jgi:hypothetical protein
MAIKTYLCQVQWRGLWSLTSLLKRLKTCKNGESELIMSFSLVDSYQYVTWGEQLVTTAAVEALLALLQEPVKAIRRNAIGPKQMPLGLTPEVFNPIDAMSPPW